MPREMYAAFNCLLSDEWWSKEQTTQQSDTGTDRLKSVFTPRFAKYT
jgi:hypothetical protein